ncbi:MAG: class I SAM-dependent methyltransferase [Dermatophilaceae bacterium]
MSELPRTRWAQLTGGASGSDYAARFEALAASGQDIHGEASFCAALVDPPARVLDAGCGTGRVALRLHELGFRCVGVDADESMLRAAMAAGVASANLLWVLDDLSALELGPHGIPGGFDLCVAAGNVIPLLAEGTLERTVAGLTKVLRPGGLLVSGFGLDQAHLPGSCPVTTLEAYDGACGAAGLEHVVRHGTWQGTEFADDGYAVSVHRRPLLLS